MFLLKYYLIIVFGFIFFTSLHPVKIILWYNWFFKVSRVTFTPSCLPPIDPHIRGLPIKTPFAPSARYLRISTPSLIEPSAKIFILSPTAFTISSRISQGAKVSFKTLPPWFETIIVWTPASAQRTASSTDKIPFTIKGSLVEFTKTFKS